VTIRGDETAIFGDRQFPVGSSFIWIIPVGLGLGLGVIGIYFLFFRKNN